MSPPECRWSAQGDCGSSGARRVRVSVTGGRPGLASGMDSGGSTAPRVDAPLVPRVLGRVAPRVLWHGPPGAHAVALTFDDGPHPSLTPRLLDVLARRGARATFFLIGERVVGHEDLVARIVAQGHEIANHLMRDEPSVRLPLREFSRQLAEVTAMLQPHQPVRWFRPGSGWFTPRMLDVAEAQGLRGVLGGVAGLHSGRPSDRWIVPRVLRAMTPGAIGVLHEGAPSRAGVVAATDTVVATLQARGRALVTLSELVGAAGGIP